jgi:hypothetical protein
MAGAGSNGGGVDAPLSNLSEIERRTLANLSIPRNPNDIVTRLHGFVPASAESVDALLRGDLSDRGWVVKMGEHHDPAALASKVQKSRAAMELPFAPTSRGGCRATSGCSRRRASRSCTSRR